MKKIIGIEASRNRSGGARAHLIGILECFDEMFLENQGPKFESIKPGLTGDFFNAGCVNDLSHKIKSWLLCQKDRNIIRENCYYEIDNYWTPDFKVNVIKKVLNN